jgi:curved DNA-binding protein CbpA|mmetsp:Transcript_86428/g.144248  ORF Transcript_86428/g.144248 Transcript_86428/m.144248 type:complete len:363 (-) Transcript_86428:85-1173(-)|eukprot:CAMPEP_0174321528 /NCGR_PEP_ID=MMETSP0810-20121108/10377_1 /TAXON_ID=73025 ORGANISM="Eutreptiella gymnastica-like, Strain CCMP1594" /NCGR_SAMPLE_ID=MMETSP0810 /ASSEMBLY_ACC=CAM_ASM_000659 /LENGTH=362 /DNA_ID=CAMNT_0015433005 /DNA_START=124 /DNA_END=1212 /DNA_ORIENTATION=-
MPDSLYYDILNLPRTCYDSDIKRVFRSLSIRWHPDKNPECAKEAERRFGNICEAYEILSNWRMRSSYDRYGKRGLLWDFGGWSPASPFSIFRGFFDEHGGHDIISTYLKSKGTHAEMPSDWDFLLMRLEEQQCLGDLPSGAVPVDIDPWDEKCALRPATRGLDTSQLVRQQSTKKPDNSDMFREFKNLLLDDRPGYEQEYNLDELLTPSKSGSSSGSGSGSGSFSTKTRQKLAFATAEDQRINNNGSGMFSPRTTASPRAFPGNMPHAPPSPRAAINTRLPFSFLSSSQFESLPLDDNPQSFTPHAPPFFSPGPPQRRDSFSSRPSGESWAGTAATPMSPLSPRLKFGRPVRPADRQDLGIF